MVVGFDVVRCAVLALILAYKEHHWSSASQAENVIFRAKGLIERWAALSQPQKFDWGVCRHTVELVHRWREKAAAEADRWWRRNISGGWWNHMKYLHILVILSGKFRKVCGAVVQCSWACKDFVQIIGSSGHQVYHWCGVTSSIARLWSCFRTVFEQSIFKTAVVDGHNPDNCWFKSICIHFI